MTVSQIFSSVRIRVFQLESLLLIVLLLLLLYIIIIIIIKFVHIIVQKTYEQNDKRKLN